MRNLIFGLFCVFNSLLHAQIEQNPVTETILGNNIATSVRSDGILFGDEEQGLFFTGDYENHSPIRSAGLWLGGLGPFGNPKGAYQTYAYEKNDFSPGIEVGADYIFNHIWKIRGSELKAHYQDLYADSLLNDTIENVFSWPGNGNPYFKNYFKYLLPEDKGRLPFFEDENGDQIYNPFDRDFPFLKLNGCSKTSRIPEETVWFTFNDHEWHDLSYSIPLNFEIQNSLHTVKCKESNNLVNNSIFVQYRIRNTYLEDVDSFFVGLFVDFQLGCPEDDYLGVAPDLNTFYVYNSDNFDEDCGDYKGYGENPPAMAVKLLQGPQNENRTPMPLYSVMPLYEDSPQPGQEFPNSPLEYYRFLTGSWKDGTPLTYGGDGYNVDSSNNTKHIFPSFPLDSTGWSELALGNEPGRRRVIASYGPISLPVGKETEFTVLFSFLQRPNLNNLENMQMVYDSLEMSVWEFFQCFYNPDPDEEPIFTPCTFSNSIPHRPFKPKPEPKIQFDFSLHPNPAQNWLHLEFTSIENLKTVEIYDALGRLVVTIPNLKEQIDIPVFDWERGIYFVVATTAEKRLAKSFLLMR